MHVIHINFAFNYLLLFFLIVCFSYDNVTPPEIDWSNCPNVKILNWPHRDFHFNLRWSNKTTFTALHEIMENQGNYIRCNDFQDILHHTTMDNRL